MKNIGNSICVYFVNRSQILGLNAFQPNILK